MRKAMLAILSGTVLVVACADSPGSITDPMVTPQLDLTAAVSSPCRSGDVLITNWKGAPDDNGNQQVCLKTVNGKVKIGGERYYDDILPRLKER